MSREKTLDEVRNEFLSHVRVRVDYWNGVDERDTKEKLQGLAFSILSAIDGSAGALPAFILAPYPHEDDKNYLAEKDEDWYLENHESGVKCDIAGCLHEMFYKE